MPLLPKILPHAELLKQRAVVPPVASELQKSLNKHWWKDYAKTQPEGTVPEEINPDAKMPPLSVFLAFVQHQALATQGRLAQYAVKATIKAQFHCLFSIWHREALQNDKRSKPTGPCTTKDNAPLLPSAGPSNEQTPLNPQTTKRSSRCSSLSKAIIGLLLLMGFINIWHFVNDYSNTHRTDVQDRIRHREELDRLERIAHEDKQRKLAQEREDEGRRLAFAREEVQRKLDYRQEDEQRRLAHEEEDKRRTVQKEREDRIIRDREGLVARREQTVQAKEDAMREDEGRRKRAMLTWQDLTPEKRCLSYEKRMYHAKLINIPFGEDAQSWCMKTAIDIHGVTYDHPDFCTGGETGTSNEPTCKTWWGNHEKKGCYGSHKMRVEAHMFNHQSPWDNWAEMCFSTPSEFTGKSFAHPDTCDHKGIFGIAGTWFIDVDESEFLLDNNWGLMRPLHFFIDLAGFQEGRSSNNSYVIEKDVVA
ncbi:hypothetical protein EDD18DRAFT_1104901 [Armillaria luteobubalina]|uniref:Uncharacterized protein n=1 Tax=Armillaria luteobubalina TaxID=153913 RepID=A0AA39UP83_9AGAR|nr:hypothetical protein EDD18DRAFT_1104901 [Armillaria luteobubalina]